MKKLLLIALRLRPTLSFAAGAPASFTYQGKLMNVAGTAPLSAIVGLRLDVIDPSGIMGTTGGNETRPKNANVLYCIKY